MSPVRVQVSRLYLRSLGVDCIQKMNEENVRRLFRQVQAASQNRPNPGPGGFFAGGGLVLLVLGGLAVNASMFNGMHASSLGPIMSSAYDTFLLVDGGHRAIKYTR
jgi:hypothetical protein